MTTIDQKAYAKLLSAKLPHVIGSETEYKQFLADAEDLIRRGDLSVAEEQFLDLLTLLLEKYEEEHFQMPEATPAVIVKELMAARDMSQSELAEIIGSKGNTSEILSGKRAISKTQAKKLAAYFKVPPHLFLGL